MELTVDGDAGELTLGFLGMLHDSVLSVHRQGFVPKGFKPESKRFGVTRASAGLQAVFVIMDMAQKGIGFDFRMPLHWGPGQNPALDLEVQTEEGKPCGYMFCQRPNRQPRRSEAPA